MIRFDKQQTQKKEIKQLTAEDIFEGRTLEDINKQDIIEKTINRKHVRIDTVYQSKIVELFIEDLKNSTINNKTLIVDIIDDTIFINKDITIKEVIDVLKESKDLTFLEFIKRFYIYNLDDYIDKAYGMPVTAIQELPYSFEIVNNDPYKIEYEFLK